MPRALRPSTPTDELAALAKKHGETEYGILTAELAAFCQSGISIVLGSRSADGRAAAGRALACSVEPGGMVRLFLRRPPNRPFLEAIKQGGGIAATFTRPETHRSIQLKASRARIAAFSSEDKTTVEAQCANFRRELVSVDYTEQFAAGYCAWRDEELATLEFLSEQAFVQTPGPGAGSTLLP